MAHPTPYPGDGVCPTEEEFDRTARSSYDIWVSRFRGPKSEVSVDIVDDMTELLRDVPPLPWSQQRLSLITDDQMLHAECVSEWVTTVDASCDKRFKTVRHYERLGYRTPLYYQTLNDSHQVSPWPDIGIKPIDTWGHLIYAWAYVLSQRWVELLSHSGEEAFLCQATPTDENNFWEVVYKPWDAVVVIDEKEYFAPWSLRSPAVGSGDIGRCLRTPESALCSSLTLDALSHYIINAKLIPEATAALAVVLTLAQRDGPVPRLPTMSTPPSPFCILDSTRLQQAHGLFKGVDRYITLSCAHEGIDSVLCSDFFDPQVACTLAGGYLYGVTEAIKSIGGNESQFLSGISSLRTHTLPLWMATVWCGRSESVLKKVRGGLWPVQFHVATWTGTTQSYILGSSRPSSTSESQMTRAEEYALLFYVRADATPPLSPFPPFGQTSRRNMSLETNQHLNHDHIPQRYVQYWVLRDRQRLSVGDRVINAQPQRLQREVGATPGCSQLNFNKQERWADVARDVTLNTMSWLKNLEGGIWLQSGSEDLDCTRKKNNHPWITWDSDSASEDGTTERKEKALALTLTYARTRDRSKVSQWLQSIPMD